MNPISLFIYLLKLSLTLIHNRHYILIRPSHVDLCRVSKEAVYLKGTNIYEKVLLFYNSNNVSNELNFIEPCCGRKSAFLLTVHVMFVKDWARKRKS